MRAALRAPAVGELRNLPGATDLAEHESVDPAVAELLVQMERVIRPNLGQIGVDTHRWLEDTINPAVAGRCPADGRGKPCRRRERDGRSAACRHPDQSR